MIKHFTMARAIHWLKPKLLLFNLYHKQEILTIRTGIDIPSHQPQGEWRGQRKFGRSVNERGNANLSRNINL